MVAEALVHLDREGMVEKMFPGTIMAATGGERTPPSTLSAKLQSKRWCCWHKS